MEETLKVPDVSCAHCKAAIEGALHSVDGVGRAEVAVEEKTVTVAYDEDVVDRSRLVEAIGSAGYSVADGDARSGRDAPFHSGVTSTIGIRRT